MLLIYLFIYLLIYLQKHFAYTSIHTCQLFQFSESPFALMCLKSRFFLALSERIRSFVYQIDAFSFPSYSAASYTVF